MVRRPTVIVLLLLCGAVGGWLALSRAPQGFRALLSPADAWNPVPGLSPTPRGNGSEGVRTPPLPNLLARDPRFVRVATFHLNLMDPSQVHADAVFELRATILAQFDLVAVQGLAAEQQHAISSLVDRLNSSGLQYDWAVGPRVGRDEQKQCLAYVFDTRRIELDRAELYTVDDPDDLLGWEPLVGWFRGVRPEDAFTFSLVNVLIEADYAAREHRALGDLFRAVRNDPRGEDDVLLLGCLQAEASVVQAEARLADAAWAVTDLATNTEGTRALDNLIYSRAFTDEATGRAGVFDFLRQLNLSLEQAQAVSTHLPVWAEFHVVEGGRPGTP